MNSKNKTMGLVWIAMCTAVIAVLSQVTIPLPTNVPITLQTFAVAFAGYLLGWKSGAVSALVYMLLGAVGVPVFAGWSGGISFTTSFSGGFIYGFIPMALLCGLGAKFCSDKLTGKAAAIGLGVCGLAACHLLGVIQFAVVAKCSPIQAFLTASAPYLIKDVISVAAAYIISVEVISRLAKTGCYAYKKA